MRIRALEFLRRRRAPVATSENGVEEAGASAPSHDTAPPGPGWTDALDEATVSPATEVRQRIVDRFELWLDRVLAEEPAPDGVAREILARFGDGDPGGALAARDAGGGERLPDRAAIESALTRLAREVGLQGRSFKSLEHALSPVRATEGRLRALEVSQGDSTRAIQALTAEVSALVSQLAETDRREADRASLELLLDLYARLGRGLTACRRWLAQQPEPARRSRWWRRLLAGDGEAPLRAALDGLAEGYAMTLGRLVEALEQMAIVPLDPLGAPFDPHTMTAICVAPADGVAAGTVTAVCEPGFLRGGELLRPAKVEVAAGPAAGPGKDRTAGENGEGAENHEGSQ